MRFTLVLLTALGLAGAPLALEGCGVGRPVKVQPDDPRFYDYSTGRVESLAEFQQLAAVPKAVDDRPAVAGAKFVVTNFSDPARRRKSFNMYFEP